ncbi:hypothetical protein BKA69DRAFT_1035339 [Paraphysoderma sedebokerense]|nr:hypothetical protein BKA69DRAFT_1035339 [Paraphysoderma sedebokerense]
MSVNKSVWPSKARIVIPDNADIGRIIGRNGKHLKQIEFVTNTKLRVDDGVIEISRGADELAQPDLEECKALLKQHIKSVVGGRSPDPGAAVTAIGKCVDGSNCSRAMCPYSHPRFEGTSKGPKEKSHRKNKKK